jgi:hypothetical protein
VGSAGMIALLLRVDIMQFQTEVAKLSWRLLADSS